MGHQDPIDRSPALLTVAMPRAPRNQYQQLLTDHLSRHAVRVVPLRLRSLLRSRPDVIHIHWPETLVRGRGPGVVRLLVVVLILEYIRLRGTQLVWTIHDAAPHEDGPLGRAIYRWLARRTHALTSLSRAGLAEAGRRYPSIGRRPRAVIPHGHYRDLHPEPSTQHAARQHLAIPRELTVLLWFGQMRHYKGIGDLVSAFSELSRADLLLVIAGEARSPDLGDVIRRMAGSDERILFQPDRLTDAQLEQLVRASDVVVLPYRTILHSGAAVHALSLDRPVLLPRIGAMPELRREVGDDWVRLFDPPLRPTDLLEACGWAAGRQPRARPDLSSAEWEAIARQTSRLYRRCLARSSTHGATPIAPSGRREDDH